MMTAYILAALIIGFVAGGAISWAVFHGRLSESKSRIDVLSAQNEMQKAAREDDERHLHTLGRSDHSRGITDAGMPQR